MVLIIIISWCRGSIAEILGTVHHSSRPIVLYNKWTLLLPVCNITQSPITQVHLNANPETQSVKCMTSKACELRNKISEMLDISCNYVSCNTWGICVDSLKWLKWLNKLFSIANYLVRDMSVKFNSDKPSLMRLRDVAC